MKCTDCIDGVVPNTPRGAANICPSCGGRGVITDIAPRKRDPRNNADDAYESFMSMGQDEWQGLLRSLAGGGTLQVEENKGFERALKERGRNAATDTTTVPDYSGEEKTSSEDTMKRLTRLVLEMGQIELEIEDIEEKLKEKQKHLREYQENLIPALMSEVGTDLYRTKSGITVELKDEVRASFPKDEQKRSKAFRYLEESGDDGIIKRQFVIQYGRDSVEWANKLHDELEKLGVSEHATVSEDWSINHQTLLAYLRGKLREGQNVPLEAFGAFVQSFAKIKRGG